MAVTVDASSSFAWSSGLTASGNHTCAAGAKLAVWVGYVYVAFTNITAMTYNGVSMGAAAATVTNGSSQRLSLYLMESPSSGTNAIQATVNDNTSLSLACVGVSVLGATSLSAATTAGPTTSTTPGVTVPSVGAADMPFACALTLPNPTSGDTSIVEIRAATDFYLNLARQAIAGDGVFDWTQGGVNDVWAAIGLRAIDAGGGRTTKNTRATEFGMELGRNLWGGL